MKIEERRKKQIPSDKAGSGDRQRSGWQARINQLRSVQEREKGKTRN